MPTLELPNLAAYNYQKYTTPPPIAIPAIAIPVAPAGSPSTSPPCYTGRQPNLNLVCQQGQTLTVGIQLVVKDANGVMQPVDITGNQFLFTAKTDINLPDTDPSVIQVNWQETNTPTQGITSLVVSSDLTETMQLVAYFYQVWMVSAVLSPTPIVTPLFSGTVTIVQPVSSRSQ